MDKLFEQAEILISEAELLKNGRNIHKLANSIASVRGCMILFKDYKCIKMCSDDVELFKTAISKLRTVVLNESRIQWRFSSG